MKALLVADNDVAIENISQILKSAGYDTIVYKWLLKALDNIEEIAPHLIVVSTGDYPRHWKTLAQYASNGFGDYNPQVILYTDKHFDDEEQKKADALHVRGTFDSIGVDGLDKLRQILSKTDDIFSGFLNEEEQAEITVDDLVPNAERFVEAKVEESDEADATEADDTLISDADRTEETDEISKDCEESESELSETEVDGAEISDESTNDEESESKLSETEVDDAEITDEATSDEESFNSLLTKFKETVDENEAEAETTEPTFDDILEAKLEAEADEKTAERLSQIADDEKAADRLEQIADDEKAADKLERLAGNEEIPTVADIMSEPHDNENVPTLPGIEELKKLLSENDFSEEVFEESENSDIIEETISEDEVNAEESVSPTDEQTESADSHNGESDMADEQSIEDKLAQIMNANKADAKEKAEALKLDTASSSVSFVFTNPITLAMVSGVARNYNGLVLEFTPDIPSFILNLSPGTKIGIASMKIDDKIENVYAEVMSNDAKKLALAIKK